MHKPVPSAAADALLQRVLAFRERGANASHTVDTAALLELFPSVSVRDGWVLDYVQDEAQTGVRQPIRPFARPIADDSWMPLSVGESSRETLVEELYQYLRHEATPEGLFEYAFFAIELWSLHASGFAAEWLDSMPVFTEAAFDRVLAGASRVADLRRPSHFGPLVKTGVRGGGRVRFLVYTPMGWQRIYYLESEILADGFVDQEAGEIAADLGAGIVF